MGKGIHKGCWSNADVVVEKEPRNGALLPVGKWAKVIICESQGRVHDWVYVGKVIARMMGMKGMVYVTPICVYKGCFFVDFIGRAEWFQDQGRMTVRGWSILLKKWSLRENIVVLGNFRKGFDRTKGPSFFICGMRIS